MNGSTSPRVCVRYPSTSTRRRPVWSPTFWSVPVHVSSRHGERVGSPLNYVGIATKFVTTLGAQKIPVFSSLLCQVEIPSLVETETTTYDEDTPLLSIL